MALTISLKLVLSPLTYKSYLSMAKMRVLKPEMDEIKAKVGEDNPTLLQQEYLKALQKSRCKPAGRLFTIADTDAYRDRVLPLFPKFV
jgi:YidC/Oxa1 family membrane protein insertase